MPHLERHHYVPKRILNNFGTEKSNGKYEVCLIDLLETKAEYRNTESVMYAKNIYDVSDRDDVKALEKKFNTEIEQPMFEIVDRLLKNTSEVVITRRELEIIKKYMMIQIFRNLWNMQCYTNPPEEKKLLSDYNIKEGESVPDFWRREMMTILDNDWDSLLGSTNLVSVRLHAQMLNTGFLMFFSTKDEFVINDLGVVNERLPMLISEEMHEGLIKNMKERGEIIFGIKNSGEMADELMKIKKRYLDTAIWMPLSVNLAVVNVNDIMRRYMMDPMVAVKIGVPLFESDLFGSVTLPEQKYVNQTAIDADLENLKKKHSAEISKLPSEQVDHYKDRLRLMAITKNKSDDDRYRYIVHELGPNRTMNWNMSVMNEAYQFLCCKTPVKLIPAIEEYTDMKAIGMGNMKNDYARYIDILKTLKKY